MPMNWLDDLVPPALRRWKKPVIGVLVACLLVYVGYEIRDPKPGALPSYPFRSILAGDLQQNPQNPSEIRGSFTIQFQKEALVADGIKLNIRSQGTAGACLLANLNTWDIPKGVVSCTTNQECEDGKIGNATIKDKKWEGVCIEGVCWTRPGIDQELCDKSPFHKGAPWPEGEHPIPEPPKWFDWATRKLELDIPAAEPVEWRVLACLNEFNEQKQEDSRDCGSGGPLRMVKTGNVAKIP